MSAHEASDAETLTCMGSMTTAGVAEKPTRRLPRVSASVTDESCVDHDHPAVPYAVIEAESETSTLPSPE